VPGDVVVLYTDGISEAMNPALEEWGEKAPDRSARETLAGPRRKSGRYERRQRFASVHRKAMT